MCELMIKIECPHKVTLFIDKVQYLPNENGEYIISLDSSNEYNLDIFVEENESTKTSILCKWFSIFKFKGRYKDQFNNLHYKAKFNLSHNRNTAKIMFEYKKNEYKNFNQKNVMIPFFDIVVSKKINIHNISKSVFINKISLFAYFLRHRWLENIICLFVLCVIALGTIQHYFDYINNIDFVYIAKGFATTHTEAIIMGLIEFVGVLIWIICRNVLFFSVTNKMSRKTG